MIFNNLSYHGLCDQVVENLREIPSIKEAVKYIRDNNKCPCSICIMTMAFNVEISEETLKLLASPHGYALFKAMEARKSDEA